MRVIQSDGTPTAAAAPVNNQRSRRRVTAMTPIGLKREFRQGGSGPAGSRKCHLAATFLDFPGVRRFNPRNPRKDVLFDPPPGPLRPEANARQRDAPSGAKVFGLVSSP